MAIIGSITEGKRARDLFVGREDLIAEFLRRAHHGAGTVMFVYGEGGIGKSLLLQHLESHYCRILVKPEGRLLDPWIGIENLPAPALVSAFDNLPSKPLKCARIDFSSSVMGEDPQDAFLGLQMIRRKLGVPTPLFLAACVIYLKENRRLTKEWMEDIFPGATADLLTNVIDQGTASDLVRLVHAAVQGVAAVHTAGASLAFGAIFKSIWGFAAEKLGPDYHRWQATKRLRGSEFVDLSGHEPDELLRMLPQILAEDINTSLGSGTGPIALLFDSHNSFFGSEHQNSDKNRSERDRWFREFLQCLEIEKGVAVVVTAQEPPAWQAELKVEAIPLAYLKASQARTYLLRAGIQPGELCEAMIRYSQVSDGKVQPLFCAMLADVHLIGLKRGEPLNPDYLPKQGSVQEKQTEIIERLLAAAGGELKYAIEACAAARAFDLELFAALGDRLRFVASRFTFDTVTKLSCVLAIGNGSFTMHSLIRRFLGGKNARKEVHESCIAYFSQPESQSIADVIYHQYFTDVEMSLGMWIDAFRAAESISLHNHCSVLLGLRQELGDKAFDRFAAETGEYLQSISRFSDAEQHFSLAIAYWDSFASEDTTALNNKGVALKVWGELSAKLSQSVKAEQRYANAIATFEHVLELAPDNVWALTNKGGTLHSWGEVSAERSNDVEAEQRYAQAVAAYDRALEWAPNSVAVLNNKGNALQSWGHVSAKVSRGLEAEYRYAQAIVSFEQALKVAPNDIGVLNNKAIALHMCGILSAKMGRDVEAEQRYAQAIAALDKALELAPDYVKALNNKGVALNSWGAVSERLGRDVEAEQRYVQAVAAFDCALTFGPDNVEALNNKGSALRHWGDVSATLSLDAEAEQRYVQAVAAYDRAIQLAPNYVGALNNKAIALQSWGEVSTKLGQDVEAEQRYAHAVTTLDNVLELAPGDVGTLNNKANALQRWGNVSAKLGQALAAEQRYEQAVAAYDQALQVSPCDVDALNNKGSALQKWGNVSARLGRNLEAQERYAQAIAAYDRAIELSPDDIMTRENRDIAWWRSMKFRPTGEAR